MEKRLLQIAVALAGLVPVYAGLMGALRGTLFLGDWGDVALDSHVRYLSGLLLAIGLGFWSAIPNIETKGSRVAMLSLIVVTGGFFRAFGELFNGSPGTAMRLALIMELVVTPLLYMWQRRIAQAAVDATSVRG